LPPSDCPSLTLPAQLGIGKVPLRENQCFANQRSLIRWREAPLIRAIGTRRFPRRVVRPPFYWVPRRTYTVSRQCRPRSQNIWNDRDLFHRSTHRPADRLATFARTAATNF